VIIAPIVAPTAVCVCVFVCVEEEEEDILHGGAGDNILNIPPVSTSLQNTREHPQSAKLKLSVCNCMCVCVCVCVCVSERNANLLIEYSTNQMFAPGRISA